MSRSRPTQTRQERKARYEQMAALATGLAHEIKNPLSTMNLTLQILREDWKQPENEKERKTLKKLDILQSEVRRLERILDEFLLYARTPKLEHLPHDLNRLVNECLDLLQPSFEKSRISVRTFLADGLGSVIVDRDRFKQALLNILINARQAMDPSADSDLIASRSTADVPDGDDDQSDDERSIGGELFVATRLAPLGNGKRSSSADPQPVDTSALEIEITDTGPGVPEDMVDRVFQPYFSTKPKGTGMGLAIARQIVLEHNGEITFSSEPGQGTQFRVRLPREE